ncbi:MAG: hypothetical protein FWD18_09000 [Micrococcales bacterium]|nr:hypothetical protein [Micrococcales bacterium]
MTLDRRTIAALDLVADPDTAWAHLRRPELIRRWYGWDDEALDRKIEEVFVKGAHTFSDGRRRLLTWTDGTTVRLSPTGDPQRTHLAVERPSHEGLSQYDGVRDPVDERWIADVHQLQFALEAHPGEDRRSWCAVGLDAGPRKDRLLDRVGLHGVRGLPVGAHLETVRPDGLHVGGRLVYRTDLQFGLRLHGPSESFLVVFEHPSAVHPPHGCVDVVLSTYGMDDDQLATVAARWDRWWRRASAAVSGAIPLVRPRSA